jgi:hypothetical protein
MKWELSLRTLLAFSPEKGEATLIPANKIIKLIQQYIKIYIDKEEGNFDPCCEALIEFNTAAKEAHKEMVNPKL